jgi:RNA polymerase-binding transcription factor DksA
MRREFWCDVCMELRVAFNDDDMSEQMIANATSGYCAKCGNSICEKFGVFNK